MLMLCVSLNCLDDCVSWCGAMGCFIWGRKYTCLCFGFLRCPCWWHCCSSQASTSIERFFQLNWFSFWLMTSTSLGDNHTMSPCMTLINNTGAFAPWGMALTFCVRITFLSKELPIPYSIHSFFFSLFVGICTLCRVYIVSYYEKDIHAYISHLLIVLLNLVSIFWCTG